MRRILRLTHRICTALLAHVHGAADDRGLSPVRAWRNYTGTLTIVSRSLTFEFLVWSNGVN